MVFTPDEVESINAYQQAGVFHPFTCGTKEKHAPGADDVLIADDDGFRCLSCDYTQDWAHSFMKDWSWKPKMGVWP